MDQHRRSFAPLVIAAGMLAALMGAYVAGYFWLSEQATGMGMSEYTVRIYPSRLLAEIFRPAAMIESAFSPTKVVTDPQSGPLLSRE